MSKRRQQAYLEPTVADVLIQRMRDESLVLYHRNTGKAEKFELVSCTCVHVEWVHPDTAALAHSRLQYVGEYKTSGGDVITVYHPKKGK